MKYLITYQSKPQFHTRELDDLPNTELVDAEDFEDWWSEQEGTIHITMFQKIGNELFEYNLRMGI